MFLSSIQRQHSSAYPAAAVSNTGVAESDAPSPAGSGQLAAHHVQGLIANAEETSVRADAPDIRQVTMTTTSCVYQIAEQCEAHATAIAEAARGLAEGYLAVADKPAELISFRKLEAALYAEWADALQRAAVAWLSAGEHESAAQAKAKEAAAWAKRARIEDELNWLHGPLTPWTAVRICGAASKENAAAAYGAEASIWHRAGNHANAATAWDRQAWAYKQVGQQARMAEAWKMAAAAWEATANEKPACDLAAAAAWENAAKIYRFTGQPARAAQAWAIAAQDREALGQVAQCLEDKRKLADSLEAVARAVTFQEPVRCAEVWSRAADIWAALGDPARAAGATAEARAVFAIQTGEEIPCD